MPWNILIDKLYAANVVFSGRNKIEICLITSECINYFPGNPSLSIFATLHMQKIGGLV